LDIIGGILCISRWTYHAYQTYQYYQPVTNHSWTIPGMQIWGPDTSFQPSRTRGHVHHADAEALIVHLERHLTLDLFFFLRSARQMDLWVSENRGYLKNLKIHQTTNLYLNMMIKLWFKLGLNLNHQICKIMGALCSVHPKCHGSKLGIPPKNVNKKIEHHVLIQ